MKPFERGRVFTGPALAQVALPLGGIGTGTVSIGGRGNLQDWELFNRPAKGDFLERTFCALRLSDGNGAPIARVLEREHLPPFIGALGFQNQRLAGLPRFREAHFRGEYPFADIAFDDARVPAKVSLEAYNPFSPLDVETSSIPCALLNYRVENTGKKRMHVALLATMQNPIGASTRPGGWLGPGVDDDAMKPNPELEETLNQYREGAGLRGVYFTAPHAKWASPFSGSAAITTPWLATDVQTHLYRGLWWDGLHRLWDEFVEHGALAPKLEPRFGDPIEPEKRKHRWEAAALCLRAELEPGESVVLPVFVHWHFANARLWGGPNAVPVRTYVANQFRDAWDAAEYTARNLERLEADTRAWRDAFYSSTLPPEVIDAASANISTIRSQTVLRASDGNIYAWEGCGDQQGSCSGNCTHVWNYEQTLAHLFPALERTMRRIEFGPNMQSNGAMVFRCEAPVGAINTTSFGFFACADGQLGAVMQAYRDWRICGDDAFLRALWPQIKAALEYAWRAPNGWDADKDGVLEGRQHNTYDIEFYGPNAMLTGIYLGALKAAAEMADHLGENEKAAEYRALYECGRALVETELWNGEYFVQNVAVAPGLDVPSYLRTPDEGGAIVPKYQYGAGCLSDQLIGQWEAHACGLGRILDEAKTRSALAAIKAHNFRATIGATDSVQRAFALQDEAGLLLCSWPRGGRPKLPFVYSDEVWTGIEYQVAAHMIYEGLVDEGLALVRAVRARYDGVRRNPFDEIECGHHYARAMSSWSLVLALSGARYDAVEKSLTFAPRTSERPFKCFFSAGTAWGVFTCTEREATIEVKSGVLELVRFGVGDSVEASAAPRRIAAGQAWRVPLRSRMRSR